MPFTILLANRIFFSWKSVRKHNNNKNNYITLSRKVYDTKKNCGLKEGIFGSLNYIKEVIQLVGYVHYILRSYTKHIAYIDTLYDT